MDLIRVRREQLELLIERARSADNAELRQWVGVMLPRWKAELEVLRAPPLGMSAEEVLALAQGARCR